MRARPVFHVTGPQGGGKTAFLERLLESGQAWVTCVRGVRDADATRPRVSTDVRDPEIRRYRDAGACAAMRYRFARADTERFYQSDPIQDYSEVICIEGDDPAGVADLIVFVAEPLPPGRPLLTRVAHDPAAERRAAAAQMEHVLGDSGALAAFLRDAMGEPIAALAERHPHLAEQFCANLRAGMANVSEGSQPTRRWALDTDYEGIQRAGLVVFNARTATERSAAEPLLAAVARLRKDEQVYRDVIRVGDKRPITAVVADLADSGDPGFKKAGARIRRLLARLAD